MRKQCMLSFAAAVSLWATGAQGALMTVYGSDLAFTYDDSSLFGAATVVGNTLFFSPTGFRAESLGTGADLASEALNIKIEVITPGKRIQQLALFEAGDYYRSSSDAEVRASGYLQVASSTRTQPPFNLPYFENAVFNLGPADLSTVGSTDTWASGVVIDLSTVPGWGSDTRRVEAMIQNNLAAVATGSDTAWIQKKAGAVGLEVTLVPVPAAVWLFGSGLVGLAAVARRRRG